MRLDKKLYGLKQDFRSWHTRFMSCLKTLDFQQCLADACVFRLVKEECVAILAVMYADDIFAIELRKSLMRFKTNRTS